MTSMLHDDSYMMQEKFDGERRMVKCGHDGVQGINRKGLYTSLPSTIVDHAKALDTSFIIDGEQVGDTLYAFDILAIDGKSVMDKSAEARIILLNRLVVSTQGAIKVVQTAYTTEEKKVLFAKIKGELGEGVVFKQKSSEYVPGRPSSKGTQLKYKFYKECSVVITGINDKRSVSMGVYENGNLIPVGNVTIPANQAIPSEGDIAEIRYLYAYKAGSLYQPTYKFARNDIEVSACTIEQLIYKQELKVA